MDDLKQGVTDHNSSNDETASKSGGQSGNGSPEPTAESFTNIDPTKLPKELQETYNLMLKDYRSKTEAIANDKKAFEQDKQYADLYKKIAGDEAFVKYWNSLSKEEKKEVSENKGSLEISDEEFAEAFTSKDKFMALQRKLAQFELSTLQERHDKIQKKLETTEAERLIDTFATAKNDKGESLHPLYDELEKLGLIEFYLLKEPPVSADKYGVVLEKVYKNALDTYNSIYNKGKEVGLGRVQEKVNNSSQTPTSISSTETPIDFKNSSPREQVEEAVRRARKQLTR